MKTFRNTKYNNRTTICFSKHIHASKKEAGHCNVLLADLQNGDVKEVIQQPKYTLQEGFKFMEKTIRPITYVADFLVIRNDGTKEIIDVKGMQTAVFKLKWKMLKRSLYLSGEKVTLTIV